MLLSFIVQPAASQAEVPNAPQAMPMWEIDTVDGPRFFTNMTDRSLAYRPDGVPCAAYGGDHLYYSCYNPSIGDLERPDHRR